MRVGSWAKKPGRAEPPFARKFEPVIRIGQYLVSEDLLEERFACDLGACHGACCVMGDDGAILNAEDPGRLEDVYDEVAPYLTPEGLQAIAEQGHYVLNDEGQLRTPLIQGKACAYVQYRDGVALCGIELAWLDGKISYRKPVSCHLYPIRTVDLGEFEGLNYERWDICKPACNKGEREGIPVYRFLKDALIRHCGEEFYDALEATAQYLKPGGASSAPE